jgi:hypothetical protein
MANLSMALILSAQCLGQIPSRSCSSLKRLALAFSDPRSTRIIAEGYYGLTNKGKAITKGEVGNDTWSALFTYTLGGHALSGGYQQLSGDSNFPRRAGDPDRGRPDRPRSGRRLATTTAAWLGTLNDAGPCVVDGLLRRRGGYGWPGRCARPARVVEPAGTRRNPQGKVGGRWRPPCSPATPDCVPV